MKFRLKMTLCMICLMSLLFGIGGSALIAISFQSSLNREKQSALGSCRLLLEAIQIRDQTDLWIDDGEIIKTLQQMGVHGTFSAISLSSGTGDLYAQGPASDCFRKISVPKRSGSQSVAYFTDSNGTPYLQVTSYFKMGSQIMCLNLGYSLSSLYAARALQQEIYLRIYLATLLLCAALSFGISWLLTRPLSALSKASREIASGNLAYRSGLRTCDEIGALSKDFDTMAQQVEDSVQRLQDSAKRQEEFMGNFAHEMKTPMTSIIGYADLLRGQRLTPEEQADAAGYIVSEGHRLERLSRKLLDIFVADRKEPSWKEASPAGIALDIADHLRPSYQASGILLLCSCEAGTCLIDPDLTRTLLLNLLENARKAMEHGGTIRITGTVLPEGYRFSVADNGRGIPAEALQHLTEAFYRVDKSRSRSQGSAGLGLTLCAKIARLHHGTIRFESAPGAGMTVTVELKGGKA